MRSKIGPLDEGDHQPAYDVKRPVPHNGPWFLILDLYRCQTSRDVEVNLYKILVLQRIRSKRVDG